MLLWFSREPVPPLSTNADGAYSPSCDSEPAMNQICWSGLASSVTSSLGWGPTEEGVATPGC